MSATSAAPARSPFGPALVRRVATGARRPALVMAALAFVLTLAVLVAAAPGPRLAVPRPQAIAALRADPGARKLLAGARVSRIAITPFDAHSDEAVGYAGLRAVWHAGVAGDGTVSGVQDLRAGSAFGSAIANDPRVLGLLCAVFILMTGVWPLGRLRNLDVVIAASLVSSVVLQNDELLEPLVIVVYPALAYLALRCGWKALGTPRPARPSTPLFDRLTDRWSFERRRRLLRLIAGASALGLSMVGLSSLHVVDVGYAVMEGATQLAHGVLPYGHIADILHGDTYPLGSYVLYVPLAWAHPVRSALDDADAALAAAVGAALSAAWLFARLVRPLSPRTSLGSPGAGELAGRRAGELEGLRAAIAWMTFPTVLLAVSTGTTDLVVAAALLGALVLWRRPAASTAILAAGGWFKLAPLVVLPLGLARLRGRAQLAALTTTAVVSAPMLAILVALGGLRGPARMVQAMAFQTTRVSPHALWGWIGGGVLQHAVQALTLALLVGAAARMRRDRALSDDPRRIAALAGAVLIGVQVSDNYWTSFYLAWVVPLVVLSLTIETARSKT